MEPSQVPPTQSDTPSPSSQSESRAGKLTQRVSPTDPKVLAGGLGASLTTNIILIVQEFVPTFDPSAAFVGACASIVGMIVGWIKKR